MNIPFIIAVVVAIVCLGILSYSNKEKYVYLHEIGDDDMELPSKGGVKRKMKRHKYSGHRYKRHRRRRNFLAQKNYTQ